MVAAAVRLPASSNAIWQSFKNIHNMQTTLLYYAPNDKTIVTESGYVYLDTKSVVKNEEVVSFADDIELFELFYRKNNSLRYCNGSYYKFKDSNYEHEYNKWLKSDDYEAKSFSLYYGRNGIVD
jgi:hypothetical protein